MMNPAEFANIANSEASFWWYRGMRRLMYGLLDKRGTPGRGAHVLEAGCGTGHFAKVLRDRYGWKMFPLDLGWEGLQFGRQYGLKRLTQGDIAQLPFRDEAFDAVVSMDVVVHFPLGEEHSRLRSSGGCCAPVDCWRSGCRRWMCCGRVIRSLRMNGSGSRNRGW